MAIVLFWLKVEAAFRRVAAEIIGGRAHKGKAVTPPCAKKQDFIRALVHAIDFRF